MMSTLASKSRVAVVARGVEAAPGGRAVRTLLLFDCTGQLLHVALDQLVQRGRFDWPGRELLATRSSTRPEEGTGGELRLCNVLADGLSRGEVNSNRSPLVALLMKPERGLVAVLVKVRDLQPAGGAQPDTGPQQRFQDGAIAISND